MIQPFPIPLSRGRRLAQLTALLLSLVALGCGTSSPPPDSGTATTPSEAPANGEPDVLHVYIWSDYLDGDLVTRFERENQCRVVLDYFDSNEAMYAKLKAGGGGYDVLVPSSYILPLLVKENLVQPLDPSAIPHREHIDPNYRKLLPDHEMKHSVPYMMSYTGIGYLRSRVGDLAPSWNVFARQDLKGVMTLLDDPRETIGAALKLHGHSLNSLDGTALAQARDTVIGWKRHLAKFENAQYHHGLASGEFQLVHGYSGDVLQVQVENPDVTFFLPEEGFPLTCDLLVISSKAKAPKLAHRFINFLHTPEVAAKNTQTVRFLCPNTGSYPLLPAELRQNPAIFPPEEVLARAEFIEDLGKDNEKYVKIWDEIKAAR